ncbi:GntR family transcriptional regulator [Ktedonobacteria bacterium brp13]|nr:GntR family transcriptional regulator [Ktedonobacteria bacterium brp13]
MNDLIEAKRLPPRQILADGVYNTIKGLLMDQSIAPEARINIDKLARELRVSPTPVREALARLESEGLVTKEALRGYSAAPLLTPSSFIQLFELRLLLEPAVARKAATLLSEEDLHALEQLVLEMREVQVGQSYQEYQQLAVADATFHDILARACGNMFFQDTLERMHAHLHLYRLYFHTGIATETIDEHRDILNALRARDAEAAASAMVHHLKQAHLRLSPELKKELPQS